MDSFLKHIIKGIDPQELESLQNKVYVFPTKRACYYFREALQQHFDATFWAPQILSIEEFVATSLSSSVTDEINLLFELYEVYAATYPPHPEKSIDKEELPTFDRFYAWGQVLLKDFDEVDRYLVDADKLYTNLQQLSELEAINEEDEEVLHALNRFQDMMGQPPTNLMSNFAHQWNRVSKTYHAFKQRLTEQEMCYMGMLYRTLAENLKTGSTTLPYQEVVFAGFNALTLAEEEIFNTLYQQGKARFFWDADQWYMQSDYDEAGKFLRKYAQKWPASAQSVWIVTDMLNHKKELDFIGGVQSVGQAQIAGQLLNQLPQEVLARTAIVLADEQLLFPVLYALPEEVQRLNVTMGYPLKNGLWYRLIQAYLNYQEQLKGRGEQVYFQVESVWDLLGNSLIQTAINESANLLKRRLQRAKSKWQALSSLNLSEMPESLRLALQPTNSIGEALSNVQQLLVTLYHRLRLQDDAIPVESELAYHSVKLLNQLSQRLSTFGVNLELKTVIRLMNESFSQARVPFSGEPIGGLQVMGFLETRALDFERLIILSANEGKLPQGIKHQSYIPFALRKAFKLPTFEEQDAIYSYHFKRLLQRSEKVSLVYNTEVAIDGSGEKSRLLWQLQQAFNHPIAESLYQMPLQQTDINPTLRVPKTPELSNMMHEIFLGENPKPLSATAVRHYLDCSLRFYFRYVLKLPERETWTDELDARDFGNIVHNALEMLYQPYIGQEVDRDLLKSLIASDRITEVIQEAFKLYYHKSEPISVQGKDVLHQQIIQKLLVKVVQQDTRHTPFTVSGTELKIRGAISLNEQHRVQLEGTLDRVTRRNQQDYILDYKTGRADLVRTYSPQLPQNAQTYLQTHFEQPRFKSGFQGLFYAWLWQQSNPQNVTNVGVFPLKKVNDGMQWLNHGQPIPQSAIELFESMLTEVLTELFDDQVDFTQTEDSDRCRFCAYKNICLR